MKCPFCGYHDSRVIDSRAVDERIRRRRECLQCAKRFTTYESVETMPIVVIKKGYVPRALTGTSCLMGCCAPEKRPVSLEEIDRMTDEIEADILNSLEREVTSYRIGELAMEKTKQIDEVAYVRFASVYRQFADINTFMNELKSLFKGKMSEVFAPWPSGGGRGAFFFSAKM